LAHATDLDGTGRNYYDCIKGIYSVSIKLYG